MDRDSFFFIFFYDSIIHNYYFLKNNFVIIFNFIFINLSRSQNLSHRFCRPFLIVFLKKIFCFIFNFWIFFYFCTNMLYFIKNIYFEIIFLICPALRYIFFFYFIHSISYVFLFLFPLLILIKKFNRHK